MEITFVKKLFFRKVSKAASEADVRMISTTQQFELLRNLLGICGKASVMDTIFNEV